MKKISKDMLISDILTVDRRLAMILMQHGMHCVGCGAAKFESLAQACEVHGMDEAKCDELTDSLNEFLARVGELEAESTAKAE